MRDSKWSLGEFLRKNAVTVMFIALCVVSLLYSGQSVPYVVYELFSRLS